jgi:predicted Zn-dependent peptidase
MLCQPLPAQKQTPPEGGTPKDFSLPSKEVFQLDNGMAVILVPYGTIPKSTIQLVIRAGNLNEEPAQVWLADLAAEFLKEGTTSLDANQLAQKAASMGGEVNVAVSLDETDIGISVLSEFSADAVELVADIVQNPRIPASELDRLKGNLTRQLSIQQSDPSAMALERFRKVLYGDHPYGRVFPTAEMIESYSVETVQNFLSQNFGAARSALYVVGRFNSEEVKAAVHNGFNQWEAGPSPVENIPSPSSKRAVYLVDRPGSQQSNLILGLPVADPSHPDYLKLQVTNMLLGGFFSSRITTNIREDKGYTYSPFSQISSRFRDAYWQESAAVSTEVTGPAIKEILYEINRLQETTPSHEELDGIKNYMSGVFVLQNSSRGGIIGILSMARLHSLDDSFLTNYVRDIHAVTPEEVSRMVNQYIRPEDLSIVVVGDKSKILDQIKAFGNVVK